MGAQAGPDGQKVDVLIEKVKRGEITMAKCKEMTQKVYDDSNLGVYDRDNEFEVDDGDPGDE